jgi:hypothetical protein
LWALVFATLSYAIASFSAKESAADTKKDFDYRDSVNSAHFLTALTQSRDSANKSFDSILKANGLTYDTLQKSIRKLNVTYPEIPDMNIERVRDTLVRITNGAFRDMAVFRNNGNCPIYLNVTIYLGIGRQNGVAIEDTRIGCENMLVGKGTAKALSLEARIDTTASQYYFLFIGDYRNFDGKIVKPIDELWRWNIATGVLGRPSNISLVHDIENGMKNLINAKHSN